VKPGNRHLVTGHNPDSAVADRATREQILDAAEALFVDRGFKGVSMRAVADAVRVTQAALYYHFPGGKEELFRETLRRFLGEIVERAFQGVESTPDFRERLIVLTRNVLSVPLDRLAPLLRDAHAYLGETTPDLMSELSRTFMLRTAQLFQEAVDAGEIGAAVPAGLLAALHQGMCIALLNGGLISAEERTSPGDEGRLAQTLVAVLLDGVGRAAPAGPTS
jgi:TetR/AcrR family transcriptional regulator, cholesterol catabolism regulator